jgi:hypothetical protein
MFQLKLSRFPRSLSAVNGGASAAGIEATGAMVTLLFESASAATALDKMKRLAVHKLVIHAATHSDLEPGN